jgi:hypothetical protein
MIGRRRKMMLLRHYIMVLDVMVLGLPTVCGSSAAVAAKTPGVTSTSIKIGLIFPFGGPASLPETPERA